MREVVLATTNRGKIAEMQTPLSHLPFRWIPQETLGVHEVEESGVTFLENALIKARHASKLTGLYALAEDSGLIVPSLGGEPGIYSARYAAPQTSADARIKKLLARLETSGAADRQAFFYSVVVLMPSASSSVVFFGEGVWPGEILHEPRGFGGFGYDPIFFVPAYGCSAAELSDTVKVRISHRALALEQLKDRLLSDSCKLIFDQEGFKTECS